MLNVFPILGSSQQHSKIGKGGLFRPSAQPKAKEVTAEDRRDKRQGMLFTAFSIAASMCIYMYKRLSVSFQGRSGDGGTRRPHEDEAGLRIKPGARRPNVNSRTAHRKRTQT